MTQTPVQFSQVPWQNVLQLTVPLFDIFHSSTFVAGLPASPRGPRGPSGPCAPGLPEGPSGPRGPAGPAGPAGPTRLVEAPFQVPFESMYLSTNACRSLSLRSSSWIIACWTATIRRSSSMLPSSANDEGAPAIEKISARKTSALFILSPLCCRMFSDVWELQVPTTAASAGSRGSLQISFPRRQARPVGHGARRREA